jgi:hypothetical protein
MVRVVGAQPTDSWSLWCRFVAGVVVGRRNGCVVVGVEAGVGFGYAVAEVVAGEGLDPMELLVFARSLLMFCLWASAHRTVACLHKMDSCSC